MKPPHFMFNRKFVRISSIDLNGNKGPNTVGKDIGVITVLYPSDSVVVAPVIHNRNTTTGAIYSYNEALKSCNAQDNEYRIPNRHELMSMFYNANILGIPNKAFWSSSPKSVNTAWIQSFITGLSRGNSKNATDCCAVRCVKR